MPGYYVFTGLPAGAYKIVVDDTTLPIGYVQTGDPDDFGATATNPDNQTTQAIIVAPGDAYLNADFGYQPDTAPSNTIGDYVFVDVDSDSMMSAVDMGIAGVSLSLIDIASGLSIATTYTDETGMYLFEGLPDGEYTVVVTDVDNLIGGLSPVCRSR